MQKALGILLVFAGVAGAYYVLSGKLGTTSSTVGVVPGSGTAGETRAGVGTKPGTQTPAQSGDNKPAPAKDIILPSQTNKM